MSAPANVTGAFRVQAMAIPCPDPLRQSIREIPLTRNDFTSYK